MQKTTRSYFCIVHHGKTFSAGHEKAKIESEFNYKACCNDNNGLKALGAKVYHPSTCSQKTCSYDKYLPFSQWISKQVKVVLKFKFLIYSNRSFLAAIAA